MQSTVRPSPLQGGSIRYRSAKTGVDIKTGEFRKLAPPFAPRRLVKRLRLGQESQ